MKIVPSAYNVRSGVTVNRQNIKTSKSGFETFAAILRNDLSAELKYADSINIFTQKIKALEPKWLSR